MFSMLEERERGFSYRARMFKNPRGKAVWHVKIKDQPGDPEWAGWTVLTRLAMFEIPKQDEPEDDETLVVEGVIL